MFLFLTKEIIDEYHDVLLRPKFGFPEQIVSDILNEFNSQGITIDAEHIDIDMPDPKDLVFYEVVMEGRKKDDAYLVTGNIKHFPNKPFIDKGENTRAFKHGMNRSIRLLINESQIY